MLQKQKDYLLIDRPFYHKSIKESHLYYTICICICYICTQVFTVILKGLPGRFYLSFNGDPPPLTLNHCFPVIRLSQPKEVARQMPLAHYSRVCGSGNRTPDLLLRRQDDDLPLHHQPNGQMPMTLDSHHYSTCIE